MSREWDQDDWDERFEKKKIVELQNCCLLDVSENNVVKSSFATENFISLNLFFKPICSAIISKIKYFFSNNYLKHPFEHLCAIAHLWQKWNRNNKDDF
jgi:hypothetical protein